MLSRLRELLKAESGITVLEMAIMLIAFILVAAIFAFTIVAASSIK